MAAHSSTHSIVRFGNNMAPEDIALIEAELGEIQVQEMRQAFALFDADEDGTISVADVDKVVRSLGQEVTSFQIANLMEELHLDTELSEMFELFDKDGDGVISVPEVKTILRSIGQDPGDQDVHAAIEPFDLNGNGTIEFCEFLTVMAKLLENTDSEEDMVEIFRILDQDGDGYISKADLREIVIRIGSTLTNQDLDEMINEADKDGDGQIGFEEFLKIITARS